MRDRFGLFALEEQKDTEVRLRVKVRRVDRNDFVEHRYGERWFLFLEILLCLLFEAADFMLHVIGVRRHQNLRHQNRPGQREEKCPTGS